MEVYGTRTYVLSAEDEPIVTAFKGMSVGLHQQGWSGAPEGFTIHFLPAHIPILQELLVTLHEKDMRASYMHIEEEESQNSPQCAPPCDYYLAEWPDQAKARETQETPCTTPCDYGSEA